MSYSTIRHFVGSERLIVHQCWCGISHAIPQSLHQEAVNNGHSVWCPLGHSWVIEETENDKLRKRLQREEAHLCRERARHDQTRSELEWTERSRNAHKGAKTRLMNRVARGVCPCCQRSFTNLHRHMETKHPNYLKQEAKA